MIRSLLFNARTSGRIRTAKLTENTESMNREIERKNSEAEQRLSYGLRQSVDMLIGGNRNDVVPERRYV